MSSKPVGRRLKGAAPKIVHPRRRPEKINSRRDNSESSTLKDCSPLRFCPYRGSMTVARNIDLMPGARLRQLHRGVIDDESDVREILLRAGYQRAVLHNGVDRKSEPRTALIREVGTTELVVIAPNLFAAG